MLFKAFTMFLCGFALVTLSSCGNSKAGGSGEFATVFAEPTAATLTAPIAPSTATFLVLSATTPSPVQASFVITNTAYSSSSTTSTITPSDLNISPATVSLSPADTFTEANAFPTMPGIAQTQYCAPSSLSLKVGPNSETLSIQTAALLTFLQGKLLSGQTATYWVNVTFHALEVTSGKSGDISFPNAFQIQYSKP